MINARVAQRSERHLKHSGGRVAKIGEGIHGVINRDGQTEGSCGLNPAARTNHHNWRLFEWAREIGNPLYMTRWMIDLWFFSIRLHCFHRSDDQRAMHDHAWSFITLILKGGYWDVTENDRIWCGPRSIHFRPQNHKHTIIVPEGKPSWSIIITGRHIHRWGFYIKNSLGKMKFLNSQRYFRRFGHH